MNAKAISSNARAISRMVEDALIVNRVDRRGPFGLAEAF
jgi:hypothetical protein